MCVDIYESLPVPFGLVRFGVAPDHPEVKVCTSQIRQYYKQYCYCIRMSLISSQRWHSQSDVGF